jgi:hypothetical protein
MFIPQLAASGLGLLAQIPSMVNQFQVAKEQKKRAGELQQEAKNVKKRDIRPEYMTALNEAELLSLKPMANYEAAKANIDANSANALRSIREGGVNGVLAANTISAVLANQNKELTNLDATQGQFKLANRQNAIQELKGVGAEQERLTQEQLDEKRKIMASAEALLQSSTANKQNALETVGSTVAGLGTALGKGISAGADIGTLKDKLDKGQLNQQEFDAARRNTLYGTNQVGTGVSSEERNAAISKIVSEFDTLSGEELKVLMDKLLPSERAKLEKLGKK